MYRFADMMNGIVGLQVLLFTRFVNAKGDANSTNNVLREAHQRALVNLGFGHCITERYKYTR